MASTVAIDIRNLSLTFQTADTPVTALSKVDLQVRSGEFVSLIGPSGCGKTTLMRLMADLVRPTAGSITVSGTSPAEASRARPWACGSAATNICSCHGWTSSSSRPRAPTPTSRC